ncbi:MAG TPA: hypothetical protein VG943_11790 [Caulobacterales bacterium]|nr:hypothetical protein [Caulobacterales bacterium]
MREDDIDWLNASSDYGLISLCDELAALSQPVDAIARLVGSPRRNASRMQRRTPVAVKAPRASCASV